MFIIFLSTGTVLALFHSLGKHLFLKQLLKTITSGFWRSAYFCHMDWYFIEFVSFIRIQWPNNLYDISWPNFKTRQFFVGFKSHVCWERTAALYCQKCWLKNSLIKFSITEKSVTSWLPIDNGGISWNRSIIGRCF